MHIVIGVAEKRFDEEIVADMKYVNFNRLSLEYDEKNHTFSCYDEEKGLFLKNGSVSEICFGDRIIRLSDYKEVALNAEELMDKQKLTIRYSNGPEELPGFGIDVVIDKDSVNFIINTRGHAEVHIKGELYWGADPAGSTYAVCLEGEVNGLRTACGPAASKVDNALYDRLTDSVLEIDMCERVRFVFDWEKNGYLFKISSNKRDYIKGFRAKIHSNYYAKKYSVPFSPIRKNHQFPIPPAGWMTWYAVQFDASNRTVLENANWLAENLKDYGANCIWVDVEWYHSDMSGKESPGVDTFNPKKERYPYGLKYVSDEIRKLGLIPALWIGATNDTNKNRMLEENPEWILVNRPEWCGQWWIDPSHPGVVGEYIPAVFNQLLDWGYEAFKWDCLSISLNIFDQYHDRFHDRSKSSERAFRDIIKAARDVIGENRYMMSCSGNTSRDIMFAADCFDGTRTGGDIFYWHEFVDQGIGRILEYYLYHNVILYADGDNIIIRKEFNSMEQARSRVSFYALAGLPATFGDNLPELEEERVNLLKKALPVVDIHPMDIRRIKRDTPYVLVNLNIAKSFGSWNVVDVMNTTGEELSVRINLGKDLCLDTENGEEYLLYDFWKDAFLGVRSESLDLALEPYDSKVVSLSKVTGYPQVVSTSRHITQGAYDIDFLKWDDARCLLSGKSRVIAGVLYKIVLYVPEGFESVGASAGFDTEVKSYGNGDGLFMIELISGKSHTEAWNVEFRR